jgi:putative hydrolase of the HAD superfamily
VRFRAVVFDLWQTLVPWDVEESKRFHRELADAVGVEPERFWESWISANHLPDRNTGPIAEHFRALFAELGVDPDLELVLTMRRERARRSLTPRPEALPTLEELRRRGHLLGMISVCTEEVPQVWDETPLGREFDAALFSCEVGISKPDPRIYELCCERLSVEAAECLFVGDGANDELPGAERVGMTSVQLRVPGEELTEPGRQWRGATVASLDEVLELA